MSASVVTSPGTPDALSSELVQTRPWLRHYEPGVPAEIDVPEISVDQLLRQSAERFPNRDALVFFGTRTTFKALDEEVDRFAHVLRGLGIVPGDRVSLHLPTSPTFVIAFLGVARAGAIAVPMNPLYVERELAAVLDDAGARLSVCLDLLVPRLRAALSQIPPPESGRLDTDLIVTGIQDCLAGAKRLLYPLKARREGRWRPIRHTAETPNFYRLLAEAPATRFESAARPSDPAVLQPTGGTTGLPKSAVLTHRNLVANAHQVAAWHTGDIYGRDSILCVLPYFHSYGLTVGMNYALLVGATQLLLPRFDPEVVLKTIEHGKPRLFPGAPIMYAKLLARPDIGRYDLHSVASCISGAAPLPGQVQEQFEALTGGRLTEGYGLSEASPVTHCNPVHGERRLGSIGLPWPSTEARIVDLETGRRDLPPGEAGELCVRGPQVFAGYWNRPDETAHALRDGWLHTGDVAVMDEDGYFRIVDRIKDLIDVGGINVYPREIEEVLFAHSAVAEAAVVGVPDAMKGEVPLAFVVLRPDVAATVDELLAYCRANLARYKVPATIEIRSELPTTMIGKVLRRVLVAEVASRAAEDSEVASRGAEDEVAPT